MSWGKKWRMSKENRTIGSRCFTAQTKSWHFFICPFTPLCLWALGNSVLERSHPAKHFTEIDEECVWSGRTFLSMVISKGCGEELGGERRRGSLQRGYSLFPTDSPPKKTAKCECATQLHWEGKAQ